jgi:hypothetical protein
MMIAKTMHMTEYGIALSALVHPHESGMPALMTLQMYRIPSTSPIAVAEMATIQPRKMEMVMCVGEFVNMSAAS